MYNYIICMKSGKEYKIESELIFKDLMSQLMPINAHEIKVSTFKLSDCDGQGIGIIGSEISSVEYFISTK